MTNGTPKDALKKRLLETIQGKNYRPVGLYPLLRKVSLPRKEFERAKMALDELVKEERVRMIKKRYHPLESDEERDLAQGSISTHPRGFGFVTPKGGGKTIFIPKPGMNNAVDGDEVLVEIWKESSKGPEGGVVEILKRGRETLAGTIVEHDKGRDYIAYIPLLGPDKEVIVQARKGEKLEEGERLLLRVLDWEDDEHWTLCEPIEKIGHINDATADIPAAVSEFALRVKFPSEVVEEAKQYGKSVDTKEKKKRIDLTGLETVTIDPKDAKDYDDALTISKEKGIYTLLVHIADVSFYARAGSKLDREAQDRGNSTYFPGRCVPMLPEELSNELCSLKEGVDRFAVTVTMRFDESGDLIDYGFDRTVIHSNKRFTYEEAFEVLEGREKSPHEKMLHLMRELCGLLKQKRFERGSVDLALPELYLKIGKDGVPTGYEMIEYDITHQMVEECMLKANEVVAKQLMEKGDGGVFRIHETPDPKDFEAFFALARQLGFVLPQKVEQSDIQKLFEKAKNGPHLQELSVAFIRSMKLAVYSDENVGHFGLGLDNYCHFTSPIRRYSDLVVHRILFGEKVGDLDRVAARCSETEQLSDKAESRVRMLKKLRYLEVMHKQDPEKVYAARISKIKPFGIFFEFSELMLEGFIHISEIGKDYYEFHPESETLRGRNSGKTFRSCDTIGVKLEEIDLIYLETFWKLAKLR